jgi:predicted nuclease of predicted toxin-antitoxin system
VLVTKDSDFVTGYWRRGAPPKLLLVSTGNIGNDALLRLFADNLPAVVSALAQHEFVELSHTALTIHA